MGDWFDLWSQNIDAYAHQQKKYKTQNTMKYSAINQHLKKRLRVI